MKIYFIQCTPDVAVCLIMKVMSYLVLYVKRATNGIGASLVLFLLHTMELRNFFTSSAGIHIYMQNTEWAHTLMPLQLTLLHKINGNFLSLGID